MEVRASPEVILKGYVEVERKASPSALLAVPLDLAESTHLLSLLSNSFCVSSCFVSESC